MIKELHLKNWKSFESATLYIDPLSILIGPNASGKSNILDAFLFLYRISWGKQLINAVNGDNESTSIRGGIDWVVRKGESNCEISVVVGADNQDYKYTIQFQKSNGSKLEITGEFLEKINSKKISKRLFYTKEIDEESVIIPAYFSTGTQGKGTVKNLNRSFSILSQLETLDVRKEVKEVGIKVLSTLKSIFILDPIPNHMRSYTKLSSQLQADASNLAGVLAALEEERKNEVEKLITQYVSRLPERDVQKVWAETVGKFGTDAMLYCQEKWNVEETIDVDARGMSDGTLRFISIITALLTGKENSLLIVEEIDNGLHPSRAHELVRMLMELGKKRNIDVLCTTHNPALIDAFGGTMIPFIQYVYRDKNSGISKIKLLEDFDKLAKIMASGSIGYQMVEGNLEKELERDGDE